MSTTRRTDKKVVCYLSTDLYDAMRTDQQHQADEGREVTYSRWIEEAVQHYLDCTTVPRRT